MEFSFTTWSKKNTHWLFTALFVFFLTGLQAQTCTFTVEMFDTFGDGWNGNILTVVSDGVETTFTIENGDTGTGTFEVTTGASVVLTWTQGAFITEPFFNILDPDGFEVFSATPTIPAGELFNGSFTCPLCPAPNPNLLVINPVTDSSAFVNWFDVDIADAYIVEYGPAGFLPGTGLVIETVESNADLQGLNPCVTYEFYLYSNCGIDSLSNPLGPLSFTTDYIPSMPGDTCTYTLDLFDSFGDGWNGSILTVNHNGNSDDFTIDFTQATMASYEYDAISNLPLNFTFTPGGFLNETSYDIIDPSGMIVFSDGPFPAAGEVYSTIACPTCPAPLNLALSDVNATNAALSWDNFPGAAGTYNIEYGPMGFTLGTGTQLTVPITATAAPLTGLEENSWYNVYLQLDCGDEFSKPLGPLIFHTAWLNDVGVANITAPTDTSCVLSSNETVTVNLANFGQLPQTLFEFYYAVNGQVASIPVPQDGFFTGVVGNDSIQSIDFETTWDFSQPGYYIIEAWTQLEGDSDPSNDTFRVEIITAFPKPIVEDFEDGMIPGDWINNGGLVYAPDSHNNETWVIGDNLFSGSPTFSLTTSRVGPVEAGDTLSFDYRYVDWFAGTDATTLGAGDMLELQISEDCGETFETVLTKNMDNHTPTTEMTNEFVTLEDYDGLAIDIRFFGTWGSGDYWLDLDNINVSGCPVSFALLGDVQGTLEGGATGSISVEVNLGTGPFQYVWSNGDTTQTISNLPENQYTVTVTDANGCSDSRSYDVGVFVAADEANGVEQISLFPNPTSGLATLDITLTEAMDFQVRVLNMNGQVVFQNEKSMVREAREELDLSAQPDGIYILQVMANGKPHYAKLMVTR